MFPGFGYDSDIHFMPSVMAGGADRMQSQEGGQDSIEGIPSRQAVWGIWRPWGLLVAGAVLAASVGTWLVWFSLSVQRKFNEEDIREACHRVMPDTADRCYDTVVIQRGGVRR